MIDAEKNMRDITREMVLSSPAIAMQELDQVKKFASLQKFKDAGVVVDAGRQLWSKW